MFEAMTTGKQSCVVLPANMAREELLLPFAWREFYFGAFYFSYAPVLSRWAAPGRFAQQ